MACLPRWVSIAIVLSACSGDGGGASSSSADTSESGSPLPAESTGASDSTGSIGDDTSGSTEAGSVSSSSDTGPGSTTGDATTSDESDSSESDTGASQDWMPSCPPSDGGVLGPCFSPWGEACNPYLQDCAAGSKCGFNESDALAWWSLEATCLPVAGAKTVGEPCSYAGGFYIGEDDCGADSWCNNVDYATMVGECVEFCTCSAACDTPGSICQHSGFPPYCGYMCDPLLGDDACKEGWHCQPEIGSVTEWSAGMFTCKPGYSIPSEVDPGPQWCPNGWVSHPVTGECVELCTPNGEHPCPAGFVCGEQEVLGSCIQELGYCEPT